MKSYQQYCSVARALDVVGDRWVLLIVRELMAFGPSRYSDLKRGVPGIATNMLAERLKAMEDDGLVEQHEASAPAPIGTRVYALTQRGRELEDVLRALSRWGLQRMPSGPTEDDAAQPQWSALFAGLTLPVKVPPGSQVVLGIDTGSEPLRVTLRRSGYAIERGPGSEADVTLRGSDQLVGAALSGLLTVAEATDLGLEITGRQDLLTDLVADLGTEPVAEPSIRTGPTP